MTRHLDDRQITTALADPGGDRDVRRHLSECVACRRRLDALEELLEQRRQELLRGAPDWGEQERRILDRVADSTVVPLPARRRRVARVLVAAAAVAVMALAILLVQPGGESGGSSLAVEEILAEVDATLDSDTLPGFEPLEPMVPDADELESYLVNGAS